MGSSNFNLRQSVKNYISQIKNQGSITDSDAAELTAHLYDATDELKKQGLSEEEAFIIACKRLGNKEMLTDEYSKVNISVRTNKIWAYLLIGYNMFYKIPSLLFLLIGGFYIILYRNFNTSWTSILIITSFHLLFVAGVWILVRRKTSISQFIERQVQENPARIVCLSFLPAVFLFIAKPLFHIPVFELESALVEYPLHKLQSGLAEFSFLLAGLSILGGVVSLIFSVNILEKLSLKALFEKPSNLFLFVFGILVELVAASTRALKFPFDIQLITSGESSTWVPGYFNKLASALSFGLIYMFASFLIAYYNKLNSINKYIAIFFVFGFVMEIWVGIDADISWRNTYNTVYFVSAMLLGILLGKLAGIRMSNERVSVENN